MSSNINNNCINKLVVIGQQLKDNELVERASQRFKIEIDFLDDNNIDLFKKSEESVLFVTQNFSGDIFEELVKHKKYIISPLVLNHCIVHNIALPQPKHPLYNFCLKDAIICFSPIFKNNRNQTELVNKYLQLIRFMSGQSRKDMKSGKSFDRTHLIENRTDTDNYRCAVIYGIPIVFKEWIDELWEHRDDPVFNPSDPTLLSKHKIKPFHGLRIAFINFSNNPTEVQQKRELEDLTIENGGEVADPQIDSCTHFVLNAEKDKQISVNFDEFIKVPDFVVYKSWFLESVNMKNREEEEAHLYFSLKTRSMCRTPSSAVRSSINVLSPEYDVSFNLDSTSISKSQLDGDIKTDAKTHSKTYYICHELCQTETNYVKILKSIIEVFRDPLKNHQMGANFPNDIEIKTIFGCLPPIIEVHEKVLSKIEKIIQNWSEDNEVGKVFVEHSEQFLTAYPQYVNFHEKTKEMIDECVEKYPKFSSFLKVAEKTPIFGRQTLKELLINPIQRLPRVQLYLETLLKKTDETKSDYNSLKEALNTIVEVNKRINKGREKTECQFKLFDLANDIEDCPATLISSHRNFISNCDVKLLIKSDSIDSKEINKFDNYLFSLLLFNDLLILCKKRTLKRTNSLSLKANNYPNSTGIKKSSNSKKTYKYIEQIDLTQIKYIFTDKSEEFENSFAIVTYQKSDLNRSLPVYPFLVKVPEFNRDKFLADISQNLLEMTLRESQENVIQNQSFKSLDFSYANLIARTVSKSKYALMRTKGLGEKINRTFSMRRHSHLAPAMSLESLHVPSSSTLPPSSPSSTRRLSRMVSNFLSPIGLPNRNSSRYMSSMNSMTSLNENFDIEGNANFSLPTTPAPRKKKCPPNSEQNMQI